MNCPHWIPAPHLDSAGQLVAPAGCLHPHATRVAALLARELGDAVPAGTCPLSSAARAHCRANPNKIRLRMVR